MLLASLQRLAACSHPALGSAPASAAIAAAAAVFSSSSSSLWLRRYSDEASGSGKPAEGPAAAAGSEAAAADGAAAAAPEGGEPAAALEAAAAAEGAVEEPQKPPPVPDALIDHVDGSVVPAELFTKRQLAWMGVTDNPEKYKHFLPRLARKELGSFSDEYASEEFDMELDLYPTIPEDVPLYDLRDVVPEIYEPTSDLFERLQRLKDKHPQMPIDQFVREVVGIVTPEEQPPRPDARRIIRWQIRHVFSVGVNEGHPANKKVKAWVHLRDLQREHNLTDAALQHIALICGPRYDPNRGLLKLTSDRYPHREANRAHILQMLKGLVEEGHKKHPAAAPPGITKQQPAQQQEEQQQGEEQQQQGQQTAAQ